MSALWIHLEMYPLFISPVLRSFGEMVEMCSQATPASPRPRVEGVEEVVKTLRWIKNNNNKKQKTTRVIL